MKILQVSPQFPYPLDSGGKIGIYNIVKQLSRFGAEVAFVAFSRYPIQSEYLEHFQTFCSPYVIYENTSNNLMKVLKFSILNKPILTEKYFTKKSKTFFENLLRKINFDIIHIDHTAMFSVGKWLSIETGKPLCLRLHNIEWLIWERYYKEQTKFSPKKFILKKQTQLLKAKETEAITYSKASFTCTEHDKMLALELVPNANVLVASPGVDLQFWQIDTTVERNPYEIVFATTYNWLPNLDGLKWYLNNVHNIVVKMEPKAFLTILGKNPPEFCKKYPNVNIVGYVPKVQPYYNRANVFIVPLFVGSGVRLRILEAMAMGLPVVSTSIGAEGVAATEADGLFISDIPEMFATNIVNLIQEQKLASELRKNARDFIEKNYSVEKTIKVIYNEYKRLLEESR